MVSRLVTSVSFLSMIAILTQNFAGTEPLLLEVVEPSESDDGQITSVLKEIADELLNERASLNKDDYDLNVDKRGRLWGTRGNIGIVPFYKYRNAVNYGASRHNHRLSSRYGWFRPRGARGEYRPYIKRFPIPTYDEVD